MPDNNVLHLNDLSFDDAIKTGVVLVDMWAPWCGPCQMQGPIIEQVAEAAGEKAKVAKLNVDQGQAVAARFGVHSIPTLILFKDGDEVRRFVGVQSEAVLVSAIEKALKE